jgi:hypothetical protein
LKPLKERQ